MTSQLQAYIAQSSLQPVHEVVSELAHHIRNAHENVKVILAYGSALRESNPDETLIDFYVLTESLEGVSTNRLSRLLCRACPPNVYYVAHAIGTKTYRAKYAVLPIELLAAKVSPKTANPYFWARFCQPMRIVWSADAIAQKRMLHIIEKAMETARWHARQLASTAPAAEQWVSLFKNTYPTELRPEDSARAELIVQSNLPHFELLAQHAGAVDVAQMPWSWRRWQGKTLSVFRLIKAGFTFQGGADYAAWKIKRHSGVEIAVKPWHRKHPILASVVLLPKLLRKGALK